MRALVIILLGAFAAGCSAAPELALPLIDAEVSDRSPSDADMNSDHGSVRVGDDHYALEIASDGAIEIRRADEVIATIPADGLQLGLVDAVDDEINYDPYGFFVDGAIPPPPPLGSWVSADSVSMVSSDARGFAATFSFDEGVEATLEVSYGAEGRWDAMLTPVTGADRIAYFRLSIAVSADEAFYGLGEQFDDVNQRGHARAMQLEVQPGIESVNNEAHVPIPLLSSTKGWGVFVHEVHPGAFDVAKSDPEVVTVVYGKSVDSADGFRFHLLAADHPLDLTKHYYDLTGYPIEPARWALGPWIWRDENEDEAQVRSDVNTIRDLDLAATGYWIDRPYATAVNTFDFDAAMFTDPDGMIAQMHDLGLRVALWHTPYLDTSAPATAGLRAEAEAGGFYPPRSGPKLNSWGKPIDFTNPEAMAWWQSNLRNYTDAGVEGFKLDYAEDVVLGIGSRRTKWEFFDGSDERTMKTLYQAYYHQTYAELLPQTGGFLLCRSATIGDQTRVSVIWPGDLDANMAKHGETVTDGEETYKAVGGLPAALVAALSLGPSGYPLFGSDTGGYRHSPPDKETFVRWFQTTALSTVMQVGTSSNDVPWEFNAENGFDQQSLDLYREFARLHLRLFPYLWTYFQRIREDGRPIQRALGLAYPELRVHPNDVFLLGDHLLVAPVVERGATSRTLHLPPGRWVDWWSGARHEGPGEITVDAPLEKLPLFLSANGMVPLLRPTIDTLAPVADPERVDSYATDAGRLHVRIAANANATMEVFDGATLTAVSSADWELTSATGVEMTSGVVWEVVGATRPSGVVDADGALAEVQDVSSVSRGWSFQEEPPLLFVAVPGGATTVSVTF